ncbi:HvfX family Cu-binding RiPP maturation protein [Porticoccus sp. GXU_MW_L64]
MNKLFGLHNGFMNGVSKADFLAPLLFRVYLAPIMIMAGWGKLKNFEDTAAWFGNPDWGLGMPMPEVMTALAGGSEFVGGILLLIGLATRIVTIPLMIAMLVAAVTAHWQYGWHALPESTLTMPWEWRTDLIDEAGDIKSAAKSILKKHGNYSWLTSAGSITILKNGIEFAATYFIMLLSLLFTGGGRYVSVDYWLCRKCSK